MLGLKPGIFLWEHREGNRVTGTWASTLFFLEEWKNKGHFKTKCLCFPFPGKDGHSVGSGPFLAHGTSCLNSAGPSGTLQPLNTIARSMDDLQTHSAWYTWCIHWAQGRCNSYMEEKISHIGGCLFEQYVPFLCISYSIAPTKSFFFLNRIWESKPLTGFLVSLFPWVAPPTEKHTFYYCDSSHRTWKMYFKQSWRCWSFFQDSQMEIQALSYLIYWK